MPRPQIWLLAWRPWAVTRRRRCCASRIVWTLGRTCVLCTPTALCGIAVSCCWRRSRAADQPPLPCRNIMHVHALGSRAAAVTRRAARMCMAAFKSPRAAPCFATQGGPGTSDSRLCLLAPACLCARVCACVCACVFACVSVHGVHGVRAGLREQSVQPVMPAPGVEMALHHGRIATPPHCRRRLSSYI